MDRGELVPDEIVIGVVEEHFATGEVEHGFILDGFPRTLLQAEELEQVLDDHPLDLVLDLEVPTEIVLDRIAGRRVCVNCGANYHVDQPPKVDWTCDVCGGEVVQRDDDTEEAVATPARALRARDRADHRLLPSGSGSSSSSTASATATRCSERLVKEIDERFDARPTVITRKNAGADRARCAAPGKVVAEMHEVCIRAAEPGVTTARRRRASPARCSTGAAPARTSSATTGSRRWSARRRTT